MKKIKLLNKIKFFMELGAEEKNIKIKEAIIKVIAFFDLFDFPLTAFEAWKYCGVKCDLAEVMEVLDEITAAAQSSRRDCAGTKDGFYFLVGRSGIVDIRSRRYNFADKKFKRAVLMAKVFKFIPWIKMIAVGNIMGGNNAKQESDIDLFIITEKKRVWLTRFFCVVVTKLFGLRPRNEKTKDTICLSFFVSEEAMGLQGLMLGDTATERKLRITNYELRMKPQIINNNSIAHSDDIRDIYFIYWLASLEPVFDKDETYEKFIKVNSWIYSDLPNWLPFVGTRWREAGRPLSFFYHDLIDLFFGGLETYFKKLQIRILPLDIKAIMNKDVRVIVTDDVLKFHVNDRREYYRKMFEEKIK